MDDRLQMELIKGIKAFAGTDHEALLGEWLIALCQCAEKNLQLVKFYERLAFFPESVQALAPWTGLTMEDLRPFRGFNELVPATLQEIVSLDKNLRALLHRSMNKQEAGRGHPSAKEHLSKTRQGETIKRLRIVITEQERIIAALKKRLQKADMIDPRMR